MDSIERVMNRIEGKPVDRAPNLNIIMQFAAKYIGIPYGKYCTDYRYLVEGNVKCCREFGIDMVSAISDPFRETQGFGANVTINHDDVPSCKDFLIKNYSDIRKLNIADSLKSERMLDRIKAIELYKRTVVNEFPILGWIEGPISEACDLRGVNEIMFDLSDEPDFAKELMEICVENATMFGREQVKAGAQFIGVGDAVASLVSPDIYKSFIMPLEKKLFDEIHFMGAKVKLHICGNTTQLLELLPLTGADIIDIDWMVDFKKAVKIFNGKVSACGNFDPVKVLLQGSKDDVRNSVMECIEAGDNHTFISAGCEVPKFTPYQNLKAVTDTLASYNQC
ncbi:MAG: uroporphyrinogen decarboxylase [Ruminiclostridium sp.]|nr:uroporphyrinogen decarboxylase [Ruminiclostridium sp.]